jgi:hypothetical protein
MRCSKKDTGDLMSAFVEIASSGLSTFFLPHFVRMTFFVINHSYFSTTIPIGLQAIDNTAATDAR